MGTMCTHCPPVKLFASKGVELGRWIKSWCLVGRSKKDMCEDMEYCASELFSQPHARSIYFRRIFTFFNLCTVRVVKNSPCRGWLSSTLVEPKQGSHTHHPSPGPSLISGNTAGFPRTSSPEPTTAYRSVDMSETKMKDINKPNVSAHARR